MHKSYPEKYIKKQLNQFRRNYIRSASLKNKEAIHDFRVALKRIVAIIKFLKKYNLKRNINKVYKTSNLESFYRAGGRLREIQINKKILKTYRTKFDNRFSTLNNYLTGREKIAIRELKKSRKSISFKKTRKFESILLKNFREIQEDKILELVDQFISARITEIETLIIDRHVESKLHLIRKLIKSIKYLLEMSGQKERSYGKLNFTIERITLLEDWIGHWHDLYVFREEVKDLGRWLEQRVKKDAETDFLLLHIERDYQIIFNETVQYIYADFKIENNKIEV